MSPIDRDVAIIIASRDRAACLAKLLGDLEGAFVPALEAGGITARIWVYAQGYAPDFLAALNRRFARLVEAQSLLVLPAERPHTRIGDVVATAIRTVHSRGTYRLAMLMDDDSVYAAHPVVDRNLAQAAQHFLDQGDRAYSIKLGPDQKLAYGPFVDPYGPIMPFKEKMLWVSRAVLDEVLAIPRFPELSVGEDAVIAGLAWLGRPDACRAVHGIGTFLHLGYEHAPGADPAEIEGGYAALMNHTGPPTPAVPHGKFDAALRTGVTPHHLMPDVFVGEDHPQFIYNGIRAEVIARLRSEGLLDANA